MKFFNETIYTCLREAHQNWFDQFLGDYMLKRSMGMKNEIIDFLFEYYSYRPRLLKSFSPGISVKFIEPDNDEVDFKSKMITIDGYMQLDLNSLNSKRVKSIDFICYLLNEINDSKTNFHCFGLHEWAMVYKEEDSKRHRLPLRLKPNEIHQVIDKSSLTCTHYDAFRFYTDKAKPLNKVQLSRTTMHKNEQSACLHVQMDVYRWAIKFYPFVSAELLRACFELALRARIIDMRASPYDVSSFDLEPICIETKRGREEYIQHQKLVREKGISVRIRLIQELKLIQERVKEANFQEVG